MSAKSASCLGGLGTAISPGRKRQRCNHRTPASQDAAFLLTTFSDKAKDPVHSTRSFTWWERVDSNHRRRSQQIYSLSPLATRELSQIRRQPLYHRCNPLSIEIFRFFQFFSKLSLRFTDFPLDGRWQTCYTVSVLEKNMLLWLSR